MRFIYALLTDLLKFTAGESLWREGNLRTRRSLVDDTVQWRTVANCWPSVAAVPGSVTYICH